MTEYSGSAMTGTGATECPSMASSALAAAGAHEGEHRARRRKATGTVASDGQRGENQPGSEGVDGSTERSWKRLPDRADQEQGGNDDVDRRPTVGRDPFEEWWPRQVLRRRGRIHTHDATDPG